MRVLLAAALVLGVVAQADAASLSLTIVVNGPPSTSVTCPVTTTFVSPVVSGTQICPIVILPAGWSGTEAISGPDAALFAISSGTSGQSLVVGPTALTATGGATSNGSYNITITANP